MPTVFVDTNIFLYCFDLSAPAKRDIALARISALEESLVTSTQVLQEFYWNATKKLGMTPAEARRAVEHLSKRKIVQVGAPLVLSAIDTSERYRITFWDALIVEAAALAKADVLLSEDLNPGQVIRGMKVDNPFS